MDERQAIRAAAIRRSRRERPSAHQGVKELYDRQRWDSYWEREYPSAQPTYRTAADIKRASKERGV